MKRIGEKIIASIPGVIVLFFCSVAASRVYQLGILRYFDMDEYAYLSWATHLSQGNIPYVDFFYGVLPGFLWFLAPFTGSSPDATVFVTVRTVFFIVLLATSGILWLIAYRLTKSWMSVLTPLIFLTIALPQDKLIEIRPDTLAFGVAWLGTFFTFLWWDAHADTRRRLNAILSGVLLTISVVLFSKTIPHVLLVAVIALFFVFIERKKTWIREYVWFILGSLLIIFPTCLYLWSTGDFGRALYSITTMTNEMSQLGVLFPIPPGYFFWPNDVYYGLGGMHLGYLLSSLLWICGFIFFGFQSVTIWSLYPSKEFFIRATIVSLGIMQWVLFVFVLPLKHVQYLLPILFSVVLVIPDMIVQLQEKLAHSFFQKCLVIFSVLCCGAFLVQGQKMVVTPKLAWTNQQDRESFIRIQKSIPKNEPILDLVGLTLSYPYPYYVSNLPFGQFQQFLTRPLPPLIPALEKTNTKFIYQGTAKRLNTLSPEDQTYVLVHFTPVLDGSLLVRNDTVNAYVTIISQ